MKPSDAATEIHSLADELLARGGAAMSDDLRVFLAELSSISTLPVRKSTRSTARQSETKTRRVGTSPKRPSKAEMSKTIDELAKKLRETFNSDDSFEKLLSDPVVQGLSKANVVDLYKRVFDAPRPLAKSLTKPDVFNAIRRERITRVRSGY